MARFRQVSPLLSAALAVLVVVQMVDLVACADEKAAAASPVGTHADTLAQGGHPVPAPAGSHDDGEHDHASSADCLCHVVFAPTSGIPSAEADRAPEAVQFAVYVATPTEVEPAGLDHVPLA